MATLTEVLTDTALGTIDRHSVIVIKKLHSSVTQGTLVNWVEVVTQEDVEGDVCHYHKPLTSVSLAVLSTGVQDKIDQIKKKVLTKKLGQTVVEVSLIGLPAGLLLLNGQGHGHTVEALELFFESTRNGGEDDCVQSVTHKDSGITVIQFFSYSLPTAVENILRKGRQSGHVLNNMSLAVLPYYPVFHDCVIDHLGLMEVKSFSTQGEGDSKLLKPNTSSNENGQGQIVQKENDSNLLKPDPSSSERGQGQVVPTEDDSKLLKPDPPSSERGQGQMFPWEDDRKFLKPNPDSELTNKTGNLAFLCGPTGRNVKPPQQVEQTRPQTGVKDPGQSVPRVTETKSIHLPKHKIILLRISSFGRKMNNVQVDLNPEKEQVRITGTGEDIVTITKEMFKKLGEVQQHDHKVSNEVAVLLEHKMKIPDFTRQALVGDKIYAHVICLAKENNIRAYAFQRDQAKRAVDKMLSLIHSADVAYTDCHFKYLLNPAWQNLVQKWEGLGQVKIRVMKPEKKIRITSLISPADIVKDIGKELEKFSDVTGKPISVDGGKGKMLHYCLQDRMRRIESDVRHAGGQMDHEYKAGTYLVTVQGNQTIVQKTESQLRSLTVSIWEGNVDLSRLEGKSRPPSEEEVAVMIEGISSKKGKDFLKRFSIEHSCVVLFTPKDGARPGARFEEPRSMKRSKSMPVLDSPPTRSRNKHSTNVRTEQSTQHRRGRGNREFHGHGRRDSEDFSGDRRSKRYPRLTKSVRVGNCTITAKKGSITEEMASILVNVVGESRNFTESVIAKKFIERGGHELEKSFKSSLVGGNAVITPSAGGLLCQNVCHMVLPKWRSDQRTQVLDLESTLQEIFKEASNLRAKSIAFPAVGTGRLLEYPVPVIAECLVSGTVTACKQGTSLTDVIFVIYDEQQLEAFIKQLEKADDRSAYSFQHPVPQAQAPVHSPGYGRQEGTSAVVHPRSRSDTSPGSMTLFCTPKEKGEQLQRTLSADIRKNFLAKDKIQLHSEKVDKRSIYQLCDGKPVQVKLEQDKKKITVYGEKEAVHSVTKNVYKLLHESFAEHTPKKYTPPHKNKYGTNDYWVELYENPPVPQYWKHFKSGYGLMDYARKVFHQPSRTEILSVDPTTFGFVKSLVEKTFISRLVGQGKDAAGLSHKQLVIRKVERIENFSLYEAYSNERRRFFKRKGNGKSRCLALETIPQQKKGPITSTKWIDSHLKSDMFKGINEHYFFHGTDDERIRRISENGLDPRYGGNGMFGQGIYGAECSTKADQYADTPTTRGARGRKMLLMRLLLGDTFVTSTPYKYSLPPCKTCNKEKCVAHSHNYDSVVADGQWLFREFVVYDKNQCYPEYIITYDRQ